MPYEWDEPKRRANLAKHGVDFWSISSFEWETALIEFDYRHGEPRWVTKGFIGVALHTVVYTERDRIARIISMRKSTGQEAREYASYRA